MGFGLSLSLIERARWRHSRQGRRVPPPLTTKHPSQRMPVANSWRAEGARGSIAGMGPPPPWPQAECAQGPVAPPGELHTVNIKPATVVSASGALLAHDTECPALTNRHLSGGACGSA